MTPTRRLVCEGRSVDDDGQPVGEPCGRVLTVRGEGGYFEPRPDLSAMVWIPPRPPSDAQVRDQALAAGWSTGGPPMCPKCRRPSAEVTKLARELSR